MVKRLLFLPASIALALVVNAADLTQTPANVLPSVSAVYLPGSVVAAAVINQGQPVALNIPPTVPGQTQVILADATTNYKVIGIAATAAAAIGQPILVVIRDPNLALGVGNVSGDVIYLSPNAGKLTSTYADLTSGKYVSVLGVGYGAGVINMGGSGTGLGPGSGVTRSDNPK